jgi:hypothetical protein
VTDVPRCATCKHWAPPKAPVLWGECQRIYDVFCVDGLNNPGVKDPDSPWYSPAFVPDVACDEEAACRYLEAMADFGCVLHEPKDIDHA